MKIALTIAAAGFALALAGCARSTGSPTATNGGGGSSNYTSFLNFSVCMRSHCAGRAVFTMRTPAR